jgi:ParB/RepB/Spo0J family partition protein
MSETVTWTTVPLDQLDLAPYNPRKTVNEAAIQELAESIRRQGLLQPIVVRRLGDRYEVVCGSRRTRAARVAGLAAIPAMVHELDDQAALEAALTENLQRADVEPMEEADAIDGLLRSGYYTTDQAVADRLGRSVKWVARRRALLALTPELRASAEAKEFPIGWYELVARLDPEDQSLILAHGRGYSGPTTPAQVVAWVRNRNPLLSLAPFDFGDTSLGKPACTGCPFNTASQGDLFEGDTEPRCMNSDCFDAKVATFIDRRALEENAPILGSDYWEYSPAAEEEQGARKVVLGSTVSRHSDLGKPGEVVWVRRRTQGNLSTPEANVKRKELLAQWKEENAFRYRVLMAIYDKMAGYDESDSRIALGELTYALAAATADNPWRGQDAKKPPKLEEAFDRTSVTPCDLYTVRHSAKQRVTAKQALVLVVQKATQGELAQKDATTAAYPPHALLEIAHVLGVDVDDYRTASTKTSEPDEKPKRRRATA